MPEIRETRLPGVGVRYDFEAGGGRRVGVITRHSGRRELIAYDEGDPDSVASSIELTPEESGLLAELLGGTRITEEVRDVVGRLEGLAIDWLPLPPDFASRTIGETSLRTRTGVSIIAVVRDERPVPAPGPDDALHPGDVVVVTGTPAGIERAAALLGA